MTNQLVQLEIQGPLAHVRIHRPGKMNSLTLDTLAQLIEAAARIRKDRNIRAVILSGTDGTFSAGLDFIATTKAPARLAAAFLPRPWRGTNTFQEAVWAFRRLPVPVIAAVDGYCFGGALQLALAADYRFTTAEAQWSVLEAKWGLIPDMTGVHALSQLVPIDVAKRLTMTGEIFSGERAVELGLASEVAKDPHAAALQLAELIGGRSPDSVAYSKRIFDATWHAGARRTFVQERVRQLRLLAAQNTTVARTAAVKKQLPAFRRREVG